ncbi:peptidase inhibitor family I36 protein [Streptomyces jumonjinensis]|nr:peptidase inhibitor family I36 protein [Streptomyces jumonjinensis]
MRISRSAVTVAAALCALAVGAATATALPEGPAPEVGLLTPEAETQLQERLNQTKPVIASYQGRDINLADGWQGAQACTEVPDGKVYCYATVEEANRQLAKIAPAAAAADRAAKSAQKGIGPTASSDCVYGWVCLWEHSNYTGRRLQWSAAGTKKLGDWDFRDKASSGCVNRNIGGALVYDARTAMPDPYMALGNLYCYKFTDVGYPTGGNWNDKADYIEM